VGVINPTLTSKDTYTQWKFVDSNFCMFDLNELLMV